MTSPQKTDSPTVYSKMIPSLLLKTVKDLESRNKPFSLLDLGCGKGEILYFLKTNGFLAKVKITGVDINQKALRAFKKNLPTAKVICTDALNLKQLKSRSFDLVIANQMIEHVRNDKLLLQEIYRLLKKNGYLYLSSVLKKWYGLFWHRNQYGQIVVDPTHLREYKNQKQFKLLLTKQGFQIIKSAVWPGKICLGEYFLLLLKRLGIIKFSSIRYYYFAHPNLYKIIRATTFLPLPGFAQIEALAKKVN